MPFALIPLADNRLLCISHRLHKNLWYIVTFIESVSQNSIRNLIHSINSIKMSLHIMYRRHIKINLGHDRIGRTCIMSHFIFKSFHSNLISVSCNVYTNLQFDMCIQFNTMYEMNDKLHITKKRLGTYDIFIMYKKDFSVH